MFLFEFSFVYFCLMNNIWYFSLNKSRFISLANFDFWFSNFDEVDFSVIFLILRCIT